MQVPTLIALTIVVPFSAFFAYSVVHELLRRRREGPPDNPRDFFHFDEDAPSYEEPPEPEDDPEAQGGESAERGAADAEASTNPPDSADPDEEKP